MSEPIEKQPAPSMEEQAKSEAAPTRDHPDRRRLLQWCASILGTLASVALAIPLVGYLLGVVLKPARSEWTDLGRVDSFPEKQTRVADFLNPPSEPWEGLSQKSSAYVRRLEGGDFQVFAVNCAHLGCPVSWFPASGLFMCPCHGGVYYEDGSYASGPPPRGLYQYEHRVVNGQLQIKAGSLPTLHDPLRTLKQGGNA